MASRTTRPLSCWINRQIWEGGQAFYELRNTDKIYCLACFRDRYCSLSRRPVLHIPETAGTQAKDPVCDQLPNENVNENVNARPVLAPSGGYSLLLL